MRETTPGRWMTRFAVMIGAGVVALGVSAGAAHASTDSEGSVVRLVSVLRAIQPHTAPPVVEPIFVTEGWDWS
ncbi:hypothetical protein GCM10009827_023990 [Dactylosporangium maewongense]|uniref:Uncharacterized protein n=1 Tax=Dactylosporangium maewongense TaxID=634393 RepID=A0ABN2A251_9ACTN